MQRVHEPRLSTKGPRGEARVVRLLNARAPEARAVGPVVLDPPHEPGAVVRRVEGPVRRRAEFCKPVGLRERRDRLQLFTGARIDVVFRFAKDPVASQLKKYKRPSTSTHG